MYDLDQVRDRANIIQVAEALGLADLKTQGDDRAVARCPAHNDQGRPNLSLSREKGAICWSCGFKADVFGLVMKVKGCDFGEALAFVAQVAGVASKPAKGGRGARGGSQGLGYKAKSARGATYPKGEVLPDPARLSAAPADVCTQTPAGEPVARETSPTREVTLVWPAGEKPATVVGKWRRLDDGRVEATYTRDELAVALWVMGAEVAEDDLDRALNTPATVSPRVTLRVEVYKALLNLCRPITATDPKPPAGAVWLRDHKGLTLKTQEAVGLHWLDDWARADRELKATYGVDVLKPLGLLTKEGKGPLHFVNHRLLFPFWLTVGELRAPVFLQGRNVDAREKNERFDNLSGSVPCPYNAEAIMVARATGAPIFVCEGATDTLTLTQSGRLACGIVGTQGFKPDWAKHFAGLDVYFAFDPDDAGQTAARKYAAVFVAEGLPAPKAVRLPQGQDVTDFFTGKATKKPSDNMPLVEERTDRHDRP